MTPVCIRRPETSGRISAGICKPGKTEKNILEVFARKMGRASEDSTLEGWIAYRELWSGESG